MKSSTLIVWLLVAACIAIDLAMIGELQLRRNDWPMAGGIVGVGLTFAQVALLSLWAVWGGRGILVRGVSALLGVWALSCLGSYSSVGGPGKVGMWFGLLLVYSGISLIPLIIARSAGYTLANQGEDHSTTKSRSSPKQFTIWWLLSLMTAVGITISVVRFAEFQFWELLRIAGFIAILAATGSIALLFSLTWARTIVAAILIFPLLGLLLSILGLSPGEGILILILMMCVQGGAILSAAATLRAGGYRIVRHRVMSQPTASGSSAASESVSVAPNDEP